MGLLVDGVWHTTWYDTSKTGGRFKRSVSSFRNWITPDGTAGPSGNGGFEAGRDRYHLYVSLACPWAHRTLIFRALKQLEDIISVSIVHPDMLENGWSLSDDYPAATGDALFGKSFMHEIYTEADRTASTRVTVPVLWDKKRGTIVSNESSEIIRMFNSAFDGLTGNTDDFWPEPLRDQIEEVNTRIYDTLNNGVYKCGFATTQTAYDEALSPLFDTLDWLDDRLSKQRYLMGEQITEADWRLFTTLVRFDKVYHGHFKCNRRMLKDYKNLWGYTRALYQVTGVAETVNFDHIVRHYYYSHETINPNRIVPATPDLDFLMPDDRVFD